MVAPVEQYAARLRLAMRQAGHDPSTSTGVSWLSNAIGVTYQAAKKAIDGETKALTAENNVRAARSLCCDSEWLATGEGSMHLLHRLVSAQLLDALAAASPGLRRQAENAARSVLDLDPLPRAMSIPPNA
jgi:hypothetical protein